MADQLYKAKTVAVLLWEVLTQTPRGRIVLIATPLAIAIGVVADGPPAHLAWIFAVFIPANYLWLWSYSRWAKHRQVLKINAEYQTKSNQVDLRLASFADRPEIENILTDPEVTAANGWTKDLTTRFRRINRSRLLSWLMLVYVARPSLDEPVVAIVTLTPTNDENRPGVALGLVVHPDHRRMGYGRKALSRVIEMVPPQTPAWVGTTVDNDGIRKIMNQLGYDDPPTEEIELPNGKTVLSTWYKCTPQPYSKANKSKVSSETC